MHSWEQNKRMGVTIQTSSVERSVCAKLSPPPCPDTLFLSPSVCLHLSFPPVLLFSVTGKAFPPEQSSLEPQGTLCHRAPESHGNERQGKGRRERRRERCICIAPSVLCCSNKHKSNAGKPSTCINIYLQFEKEPLT